LLYFSFREAVMFVETPRIKDQGSRNKDKGSRNKDKGSGSKIKMEDPDQGSNIVLCST